MLIIHLHNCSNRICTFGFGVCFVLFTGSKAYYNHVIPANTYVYLRSVFSKLLIHTTSEMIVALLTMRQLRGVFGDFLRKGGGGKILELQNQ